MRKRRTGPPGHPTSYRPDFRRYEREKYEWVTQNPAATPDQYQEAMRNIAQRCGI